MVDFLIRAMATRPTNIRATRMRVEPPNSGTPMRVSVVAVDVVLVVGMV